MDTIQDLGVVSMGVGHPEVSSRSRYVNKDGGGVNDLPQPYALIN